MKVLCFLLIAFCSSLAQGQSISVMSPESVGLSSARLSRIDSVFQDLIDDGQVAGVSILISRKGRVAYRRDLGHMDIEAQRDMASDAIFRIASMTKAVTAVAVLQLFEQGYLLLGRWTAQHVLFCGC